MSYLRGGYLSGELTDEQALDTALSNATGDRQIKNFKKYYQQVAALSPAARANLVASLQQVLARLPAKSRNLVESMAMRTASYTDPRQATGLGMWGSLTSVVSGAQAATSTTSTLATIANIAALVATVGTLGLGVAKSLDERKQNKKQAEAVVGTERANQALLAQQVESQRLANEQIKMQLAQRSSGASPSLAPDGSLVVPANKPSATQVGAGVALTAAAAYLLIN